MTYPINYQNQQNPASSGITINITNPSINPVHPSGVQVCQHCTNPIMPNQPNSFEQCNTHPQNYYQYPANPYYRNDTENLANKNNATQDVKNHQATETNEIISTDKIEHSENTNRTQTNKASENGYSQAYPQQYYLNNYNYIQTPEKPVAEKQITKEQGTHPIDNQSPATKENLVAEQDFNANQLANETQNDDMEVSKEIIRNLDERNAEQKELEKNGKKVRVVALTNEYIMSLENYLNNPNNDVRLMAAKEILTRLNEDRDRYNDAALNALLNKMLQDPEKLIRIAAMSAFSSQLASGNDYTVKILTDIQKNPNSDKEDVLEAANILLMRSATTEVRYQPANNLQNAENN